MAAAAVAAVLFLSVARQKATQQTESDSRAADRKPAVPSARPIPNNDVLRQIYAAAEFEGQEGMSISITANAGAGKRAGYLRESTDDEGRLPDAAHDRKQNDACESMVHPSPTCTQGPGYWEVIASGTDRGDIGSKAYQAKRRE